MKLQRVAFKQPVKLNESNRELITSTMAPDLRFEQGFVRYTDKTGKHLVPVTNVKRMTEAGEEKSAPASKSSPAKKAATPPAATPSSPAPAGD